LRRESHNHRAFDRIDTYEVFNVSHDHRCLIDLTDLAGFRTEDTANTCTVTEVYFSRFFQPHLSMDCVTLIFISHILGQDEHFKQKEDTIKTRTTHPPVPNSASVNSGDNRCGYTNEFEQTFQIHCIHEASIISIEIKFVQNRKSVIEVKRCVFIR
jgi:hypothetical protein